MKSSTEEDGKTPKKEETVTNLLDVTVARELVRDDADSGAFALFVIAIWSGKVILSITGFARVLVKASAITSLNPYYTPLLLICILLGVTVA